MRRLRIITTAFLLLGFVGLFGLMYMMVQRPDQDYSRAERKQWAFATTVWTAVVGFSFVAAALGAAFIARRIRNEFSERSLQNFAELITAESDVKKKEDNEPQ